MSRISNTQQPVNRKRFGKNYDNIKWGAVKFTPKPRREKNKSHHIMCDIEPYKATGGEEAEKGEWITSRSKEREYLHRNGFEQVGSEKDYFFKYNGKSHDNPTREWK